MSTFAKTAEFMSKYPVLSVIAVQKPEINTGMSRSSVQEVITWIREFEITEQNFVCYSILSANRFCFLEIPEMREGIGLLQKCMQCKNVQMGLGKSEQEWTALFYINWTNNLWKNENIYYRASEHSVCSFTMPGKGRSSPWWNHFQIVDGDFRLVQCILCNKLVRRGKAGCSSKETSNSGMATHMRSKHRDQANQVVHFKMNEVSIDITLLSRCRELSTLQERAKMNPSTRRMRLCAALFLFSNWDQGLIEQSGRNW